MLFVGKTVNEKRLIHYSLLFMVLLLQDYENDNHIVNIYSPCYYFGFVCKATWRIYRKLHYAN